MVYKNKFQIGDQVKSSYGENKSGQIKCIIETCYNKNIGYQYLIQNENNKYFIERENAIKLIKREDVDDPSFDKVRAVAEACGYKSDLKVGDIVSFRNGLIEQYVISAITEMDHGEDLHRYELIHLSNNDLSTDKACFCGRLLLEFQYHDPKWEEYFTEGTRQNGLPAWRGELYNLYELYTDFDEPKIGFTNEANDYYNDTIPPKYMEHILDRHTIYGRIGIVLSSVENKNIIMSKLKLNDEKIRVLWKSIREKNKKRNGVGYNQGDNIRFTLDETKLIEQIDLLDTESVGNGEKHHVDHFKIELRNIDIMKMIKQAYHSAQRVSSRETKQTSKDRRTEDVNPQNLGKVDYEGITKDGTIIRFTYDFDVNVIDTAYPLRMNNNVKKH